MKSIIKMIIVMFLLIIAIQSAYSLGVSPARRVINFEPGLSEEVRLRILNTAKRDIDVVVSKSGELNEYVILNNNLISFTADEKEKYFSFRVNLPQKIDEPGDHEVEIIITEVPRLVTQGATVIGGRASVISQLRIRVPYPGKYAEADLLISASGDDVQITIPINNFGTDDIIARANIRILEGERELADIDTGSVEIKTKEINKLVEHWSSPSIGSYRAFVEVYYDDKVIELEKGFEVGEMFIKVKDVVFERVRLGEVAKFDIIAKSGWNDVIEDVYADVFIRNKEGDSVGRLKTASNDIDAFSEEILTGYWDTEGIDAGLYDLVVKLSYAGKRSEKRIEIEVKERSIKPTEIAKPRAPNMMIIIALVLVIILLVIVIISLRKKKPKAKKKGVKR